jgi:hypothetical protein
VIHYLCAWHVCTAVAKCSAWAMHVFEWFGNAHMHMHMHAHVHMHMCTCMCTHMHTCMCMHMCMCTHTHTHIHVHAHMHVHTHAHVHMHAHLINAAQSDLSQQKFNFGCSYWMIWEICIFWSTLCSQMCTIYMIQHPEPCHKAVSQAVSHATEHAKVIKINKKNIYKWSIF